MMFALIDIDGVVVQTQPSDEDGFVEVPDGTVAGMIEQAPGVFAAPDKTLAQLQIDVASTIAKLKNERIYQGVNWKLDPVGDPNPVMLTTGMRMFLDNTQAAIQHQTFPRPNIHGGVLFQDGVSFAIDDAGIIELALFAYSWALKVSQKAQAMIEDLPNKTEAQLLAYFNTPIDWSVTWDAPDTLNGWDDDTVTQTP